MLLRLAGAVGVLLLGLYATLPWWLPTDMLRRALEADFSRSTGAKVEIGRLAVSWSNGVEVQDLRCHQADGAMMAEAGRLTMDFSPLELLVRRRIEWMHLQEVRLDARLDEQGRWNLACLAPMLQGAETRRILVQSATIQLQLPRRKAPLVLDVRDLQYAAGLPHRLGQVSMSAVLDPQGTAAPINIRAAAGATELVAAEIAFNFGRLDLSQLDLPSLADLPLRRLRGLCRGNLDLRINSAGKAEHAMLDLIATNLDVQPTTGPDLPVIEAAGVRIDAGLDFVQNVIVLESVDVRVPGIDLTGSAAFYGDLLDGNWKAVRSLDMRGEIDPAQASALLRGGGIPGDLATAGPMTLRLSAQHDGTSLSFDAALDATAVAVRRQARALKPAGRPLRLQLNGSLDSRQGDLNLSEQHKCVLELGGNRLELWGRLKDPRRWTDRERGPTPSRQNVLGLLAEMQGACQWEIQELESLRDLSPELAGALAGVGLQGTIKGWGLIVPAELGQVDLKGRLEVPGGTRLETPFGVAKPAGDVLSLRMAGSIDPSGQAVQDGELELSMGAGRALIDQGRILIDTDGSAVTLSGRYQIQQAQDLLECLPPCGQAGLAIDGSAQGELSVTLSAAAPKGHLTAQLGLLSAAWGRKLAKPAGQPAELEVSLSTDQTAGAERQTVLDLRYKCQKPQAELRLMTRMPLPLPRQIETPRFEFTADVQDAQWLLQTLPGLEDLLVVHDRGGELSGAMSLKVQGSLQQRQAELEVMWDAGSLAYASGDGKRMKAAGEPLSFHSKLQATRGEDGQVHCQAPVAELQFGQTKANISAEATLRGDGLGDWLHSAREDFRAKMTSAVTCDAAVLALLPELEDFRARCPIEGAAELWTEVQAANGGLSLHATIDAGKLALGPVRLKDKEKPMALAEGAAPVDTFSKRSDCPAKIALHATMPPDISSLHVSDLTAEVAGLRILADATVDLSSHSGQPVDGPRVKSHVAIQVPRAGELTALLPGLKPCRLDGGLQADLEWSRQADRPIRYVSLNLQGLKGQYHGKNVRLDGQVRLSDLASRDGGFPLVRKISIQPLEFRIGENHGWLLVDLSDLPGSPTGRASLLAERLDDKDLMDWLNPPGSQPATRPVKMTDKEIDELRTRAGGWVENIRSLAKASQFELSVNMEHYRNYDSVVRQAYDLHQTQARLACEKGLLTLEFTTGMNGGSLHSLQTTDLREKEPIVTVRSEMRDMLATPEFQPQLQLYFPGNTVYGTFNRTEEITKRLSWTLAGLTDGRCPQAPEGRSTTVTVDGLVEGRAAPGFVTAIFPGLNLTKYRYNTMTSFAEYLPGGLADNDMIFSGQVYDTYITGTTDAGNIGRYTIGLILLGTPQPAEWNHLWRLGRIPILKVKARIEGGKMHDEEVTYPWPNETLGAVFIFNNPVYRSWVNASKKK